MARKWGAKTKLKFVSLYREHECLWRVDLEEYRDKETRDNAIAAIAAEMGIPGLTSEEVKLKIKSLRSTYLTEVKKIQDSIRSGSGAVYKPTIPWFDKMDSFIKHVQGKRKIQEKARRPVYLSEEQQETTDNSMSESLDSLIEEPPTRIRRRRRPKLTQIDQVLQVQTDEFDKFGAHVAEQLRQLSLEQAMIAFDEIQSILSKGRLQDIKNIKNATSGFTTPKVE